MLGGGFAASDVFEYDARITASYPSGPTTWTVAGTASSAFWLTAYAYCWTSPTSLGIQVVQGNGDMVCPIGTTILNGGFQVAGAYPVGSSFPKGNGWHADTYVSGASVQSYALCASTHALTPITVAQMSFNAHSSTHGYQPGGTTVGCPVGASAIGGGFISGGDLMLASIATTNTFLGWQLSAGGDSDVTGYAVCVAVKS